MKKFNPEKELNKIRKGNKNKILYSIITLLLIVAIGSTYALYQVRHTNKIVHTTVDEFVNKDIILSVKLDDKDESVNEFPTADSGYVYSHTECEKGNITDITWNEEQRSLNMNSKGPDKCTVYFVKSPFHMKSCENKSMSECLLEEGQKFPEYLAFDDPDSNARYMGADPANYIWFNCDDYSNPSESTCERWRIIGSFNNIEKVNEDGSTTEQNLVKIIRSESIGEFTFDNKDETTGAINSIGNNDWTEARLMKLLNPGYEDEEFGGSLYYDWSKRNSTKCYKGNKNQTVECNFSKIGLKNDNTRNMIESTIWHIGTIKIQSDYHNTLVNGFYTNERTDINPHNKPLWPTEEQLSSGKMGKVGIIYPSDYGYAVGDDVNQNRNSCLNIPLYHWAPSNSEEVHNDNHPECYNNNWLIKYDNKNEFTIMPTAMENYTNVLGLYQPGYLHNTASANTYEVRPTLYLTHDTKVTSGNGTYDNPYLIN